MRAIRFFCDVNLAVSTNNNWNELWITLEYSKNKLYTYMTLKYIIKIEVVSSVVTGRETRRFRGEMRPCIAASCENWAAIILWTKAKVPRL